MKFKYLTPRGTVLGLTVLTASAAVLGILSYLLCFDATVGYFTDGIFPTLLYIVIATALIGAIVCPAVLHKTGAHWSVMTDHTPTLLARIWSIGAAVTLPLTAWADGQTLLLWDFPSRGLSPEATAWITLLHLCLAIASIPLFLGHAWPAARLLRRLSAPSGICFVLWCILTVALDYFDWTLALNSPVKLLLQLTLLCGALYTLAWLRAAHQQIEQPRRAATFGSLFVFFSISHGVALTCAILLAPSSPYERVFIPLPLLFFGLYVVTQWLHSTAKIKGKEA